MKCIQNFSRILTKTSVFSSCFQVRIFRIQIFYCSYLHCLYLSFLKINPSFILILVNLNQRFDALALIYLYNRIFLQKTSERIHYFIFTTSHYHLGASGHDTENCEVKFHVSHTTDCFKQIWYVIFHNRA